MKKLFWSIAVLAAFAGCSSTETQKAVDVTEGKVTPPPKVEPKVEPQPIVSVPQQPPVTPGDPLNPLDPRSMLNKQRSVFFDYDSYVVKDEYKPLVTAHSRFLT